VILVTGANGFVGSALVATLARRGIPTRACCRTTPLQPVTGVETVAGIDLTSSTNLDDLLTGVSAVIHTAARVHIMQDAATDPLAAYRAVNVDATLALARLAADRGVRRFIFLSSIKVNGEETVAGQPFTAEMTPAPQDAYGQSKREAEAGLLHLGTQTGMDVVIVRPPLVYGPGVKANFARLMRWVASGWPLPLASVNTNRRSMVGIDNLIDLLVVCTQHPAAANQVFLVSDDEDLSTAGLLRRLAQASGQSARLLPMPVSILRLGAKLAGQETSLQRLTQSLQLDIRKTKHLLGWQPPIGVDEALRRTATRAT